MSATASQQKDHAKLLGVKGSYPAMRLPNHNRIQQTFVDGMHTVKDVVCNIMDAVLQRKNFRLLNLELSGEALRTADARFLKLEIPKWIDLSKQSHMISNPRSLKTHNWKQVGALLHIFHSVWKVSMVI